MFDTEFYPTPASLVCDLIAPYRKDARFGYKVPADWTILEPSAGKGNIADYIADYNPDSYGRKKNEARVRCIEKNFELQQILRGKNYPIIGDDFLEYQADQHFDLIVMNPPFSNGDEHLLHAWEVVGHGGHIACVLNAETIRNAHTKRRKALLNLIEEYGHYTFVEEAFNKAERKTKVEVALVWLDKPALAKDPLKFEFTPADDKEDDADLSMSTGGTALAHVDHLGAVINQYEKTKEAFIGFIRSMEELAFYGAGLAKMYRTEGRYDVKEYVHRMAIDAYLNGGSNNTKCNEFRDLLNASAWETVLGSLNLDGIMTTSVKEAFDRNLKAAGHMPLTKRNVQGVVSAIIGSAGETMKLCVVEVFDLFTKYYSDNRLPNQEGWKTNKSWYCNKKVILPNWVELKWSSGMQISYSRARHYQDIDKACCWLMGKKYEEVLTIEKAMTEDMEGARLGKGESEFFTFRYYMKGTVHLTFKDQTLLDRFNITASENKNWIGND